VINVLLDRFPAFFWHRRIQHKPEAFQYRSLARTFAANKKIHAWIESDPNIFEECADDVDSNYPRMTCRRTFESNAMRERHRSFKSGV
jgi:hypothetical protein